MSGSYTRASERAWARKPSTISGSVFQIFQEIDGFERLSLGGLLEISGGGMTAFNVLVIPNPMVAIAHLFDHLYA